MTGEDITNSLQRRSDHTARYLSDTQHHLNVMPMIGTCYVYFIHIMFFQDL